jgi:membrane protein
VYRDAPLNLNTLAAQLRLPADRVAEVLELLQDRSLLVATASEPPEYLLAQDPATLTVSQLLAIVRSSAEEQALLEAEVVSEAPVDAVLERVDHAIAQALQEMTLRDLVADAPATCGDSM